MKLSLTLITLIFSSTLFADLLNCPLEASSETFKLSSEYEKIINKLTNRDYNPCSQSVNPPTSKEDLCSKSPRYFQNLLCQKNGKMGFKNNKGLFGLETGVCWWHSQFHRNATYLSYFNPKKAKLNPENKEDKKKIKEIFNNIIRMKELTEIPGYSSLREFTEDPKIEKLLQKRLQLWMGEDSFLKMQWVKGLTSPNNYTTKSEEYFMQQNGYKYDPAKDHGSDRLNTKAIRQFKRKTYKSDKQEDRAQRKSTNHQDQEIEELFTSVSDKNEIGYLTLQYPGVMAHAQIVFDAKTSIVDGETIYDFKVQDSNYQGSNSESSWNDKAYSQMRYKDGIWYKKSQPGKISDSDYEPVNVKVHNIKQLGNIDKIYNEECAKPLF